MAAEKKETKGADDVMFLRSGKGTPPIPCQSPPHGPSGRRGTHPYIVPKAPREDADGGDRNRTRSVGSPGGSPRWASPMRWLGGVRSPRGACDKEEKESHACSVPVAPEDAMRRATEEKGEEGDDAAPPVAIVGDAHAFAEDEEDSDGDGSRTGTPPPPPAYPPPLPYGCFVPLALADADKRIVGMRVLDAAILEGTAEVRIGLRRGRAAPRWCIVELEFVRDDIDTLLVQKDWRWLPLIVACDVLFETEDAAACDATVFTFVARVGESSSTCEMHVSSESVRRRCSLSKNGDFGLYVCTNVSRTGTLKKKMMPTSSSQPAPSAWLALHNTDVWLRWTDLCPATPTWCVGDDGPLNDVVDGDEE